MSRFESNMTKRSVVIAGKKSSISLEPEFWDGVVAMAARESSTIAGVIARIFAKRRKGNLSSAVRVAVLEDARRIKQEAITS